MRVNLAASVTYCGNSISGNCDGTITGGVKTVRTECMELQPYVSMNTPDLNSEGAVRYCTFEHATAEGAHVDSIFLECTFDECDWYWGLFNQAVFIGVKFKNCKFRGCSFAECRFVECEFDSCDFTVDSFDKGCSFEGNRWYACQQRNCNGIKGVFGNARAAIDGTAGAKLPTGVRSKNKR